MLSRAQRTPFGEWWWTVDRLTLAAIGALMLAGVVLSLAASPPVAGRLGLDPFEIRRINAMRDGALTHTKAKLTSVSLTHALNALEKASGWEAGVPNSRGNTRRDLGRDDIRPPCALGARFKVADKQEAAE